MQNILELAENNQKQAYRVIKDSGVREAWQSIGAEINLIGSLKMGLLMTHRDIDFHIYTPQLDISESFAAMAKLAKNPRICRITYNNLLNEEDACLEWHAWYLDEQNSEWQIDMMHILKGSKYAGWFEKVAERINAVITEEERRTVLELKYQTPENVKIMGIEYYQAVIRDGIKSFAEFESWRRKHPVNAIIEWMP